MFLIIFMLCIGIFNQYSNGSSDLPQVPSNDLSIDGKSSYLDDETCSSKDAADCSSKVVCDEHDSSCQLNPTISNKNESLEVVHPPEETSSSSINSLCDCGPLCCPTLAQAIDNEIDNQNKSLNIVDISDQALNRNPEPAHVLGCVCCPCTQQCCLTVGVCCALNKCPPVGLTCLP